MPLSDLEVMTYSLICIFHILHVLPHLNRPQYRDQGISCFSYVFMVEERLESLRSSSTAEDSVTPESAGSYPVADQQDMTKLSKLFYQTGRLQGADKYIWISPFIRCIDTTLKENNSFMTSTVHFRKNVLLRIHSDSRIWGSLFHGVKRCHQGYIPWV